MKMPDPVVHAEGLRKEYSTRSQPLVVLESINLSVNSGESVVVMGPSGSGKSTLLHILGTLDLPTRGSLQLFGRDPAALDGAELARFRGESIGFVFQDHQLLPQCTALENVLLPTLAAPGNRSEAVEHATSLLKRVGLEARMEYAPAELSGGERQRVAIARALVRRPGLLLCDEPTGNLDEKTGDTIAEAFLDFVHNDGLALVAVTHDARFARRFGRTLRLEDGRLHES